VRFWAIRTRRWSYFTGKTLGLWATVSLVTLALNLIAGAVVVAKGYVTVGQLFTWGLRFWLVAVIIAGTWATIAAFVSSLFRTPMLSLLTTFVTFFAMWLVSLIGIIVRASDMIETGVAKEMNWYEYLYPNSYDTMLLSPEVGRVLTALGILLGFILLANAAGAALFQRRDI
jgi:ABC-type transport system involved in multi-copper enzyme maturation permease subunit